MVTISLFSSKEGYWIIIIIDYLTYYYAEVSVDEIIITFSIILCPVKPYGGQYHCEKQIPFCIHDKSILLLGHLGPFYDHRRCIVVLLYKLK